MQIKNKRIVIVGDSIVDEFIQLEEMGSSVEKVPTYREVSKKMYAGGAANVAKNCLRLGARVRLIDNSLSAILDAEGMDDGLLPAEIDSYSRKALHAQDIRKKRYYRDGKKIYKINSITREKELLERKECANDIARINSTFSWFEADIVLACDNRHGMFSDEMIVQLVELCQKRNLKLLVDAQMSQNVPDWSLWKGAHSIFLNEKEAAAANVGDGFADIHVKLGEKGSALMSMKKGAKSHPGYKVDAVDTLGAGDAYLAAYAVYEDINISNAWAALSCTKHGTELPQFEELRSMLNETSA